MMMDAKKEESLNSVEEDNTNVRNQQRKRGRLRKSAKDIESIPEKKKKYRSLNDIEKAEAEESICCERVELEPDDEELVAASSAPMKIKRRKRKSTPRRAAV